MNGDKWRSIEKLGNDTFRVRASGGVPFQSETSFMQLAFDYEDETLLAVDLKGNLYCVEINHDPPRYKILGLVGPATFIEFSPKDKSEVLIGLSNSDIKVTKLKHVEERCCILSGHQVPPSNASFYESYCLTSSNHDAIIWHLPSCCKAHQLRLNSKTSAVLKTGFSNLGHVVALYRNDVIQAWNFPRLDVDSKIHIRPMGLRNIKDFAFTRDGRALALGGFQSKVLILSTHDWTLIKRFELPNNFVGIKRLVPVSTPLDGGANKIIAVLSSNCALHMLNLAMCSLDPNPRTPVEGVLKFKVSQSGRYLGYVNNNGCLIIMSLEGILLEESAAVEKIKVSSKPRLDTHSAKDHLRCVHREMKEELKLTRLLPILQEFGEYPSKHRALIWTTILALPENRSAFAKLANEPSLQSSSSELLKDYPLADRTKASLLTTTVECLVNWCPRLSQTVYLPKLVFPFLVVFQKNPLLAFEAVLTILMNYCQKWFEYHPLPPLNILGILENVLLEADPKLLNVFCERKVTSTEYAWPLLQSMFSEVLNGDDWLVLWDHLLSYQKPSLFLMCAVAYNICARETIIHHLHSAEDLKKFYSSYGHVRVKNLLQVAKRLDRDTSFRIHPDRYLEKKFCSLPSKGPYPPFLIQQYPKLMAEEYHLESLEKLKEEEKHLREEKRAAAKLAEEKRLRAEADKFLKEVHQTRLDAVRRSYSQMIRDKERSLEEIRTGIRKYSEGEFEGEDEESPTSSGVESGTEEIRGESRSTNRERSATNYEKLRNEVNQLESEVQHLLHGTGPRPSRIFQT
ncbi:TBC1 domain family member 31 [Orussus abietinus]|uniref:TBC1 domain family member 31 n=1 Tax=Orussus abietinus TaxID=222816 RepID=UPI0006259D46|nr:TBC1 domain family member 31 [Orussus abietinus]